MGALNPNPRAEAWRELASTKSGRSARLGNPDVFTNARAKSVIAVGHSAVHEALQFVDKLSRDESRTDVSKAFRAKKETDAMCSVLSDVQKELRAEADKMEAKAKADIGELLALDPTRAMLQSRKIDLIATEYAKPNGPATIAKLVKSDKELAGIFHAADAWVLGISEEACARYGETAIKTHAPNAANALTEVGKLREVASKYDEFKQSAHSSLYIPDMAERFEKTHVE